MAPDRGWSPIAVTVLALVVVNVAWNRLVPDAGYVPFAVAASVALVAVARQVDGLGWKQLGLAAVDVPRGLRWGGALAAVVALGYLVGFALGSTRDLFLDERVEDLSFAAVAFAAFVRVPLGTVLLEEVAFRSVLPAALATRLRLRWAVLWSSVAFGLWHVLPALGLADVNPVADDTVGQLPGWVTVVGSVAATTVVGVFFCWLRYRSRSLLAPMLLHWSTNALGYLFAWWAWNR
jgi:membrane protease YdiL (CAAX protease family)